VFGCRTGRHTKRRPALLVCHVRYRLPPPFLLNVSTSASWRLAVFELRCRDIISRTRPHPKDKPKSITSTRAIIPDIDANPRPIHQWVSRRRDALDTRSLQATPIASSRRRRAHLQDELPTPPTCSKPPRRTETFIPSSIVSSLCITVSLRFSTCDRAGYTFTALVGLTTPSKASCTN